MPIVVVRTASFPADKNSAWSLAGAASRSAAITDNSDASYIQYVSAAYDGGFYLNYGVAAPSAGSVVVGIAASLRGFRVGWSPQYLQLIQGGGVNDSFGYPLAPDAYWNTSTLSTISTAIGLYDPLITTKLRIIPGEGGSRVYDVWLNKYEIVKPTLAWNIPATVVTSALVANATSTYTNDTGISARCDIYAALHTLAEYSAVGFAPNYNITAGHSANSSTEEAVILPVSKTLQPSTTYRMYYKTSLTASNVTQEVVPQTYIQFTTSAFTAPNTPTLATSADAVYTQTVTATISAKTGLTHKHVIFQKSTDNVNWTTLDIVTATPAQTSVVAKDYTRSPNAAVYYRSQLIATDDATSLEVASALSAVTTVAAVTNPNRAIKTTTLSLSPAIITGWDDGDFSDDSSIKWPIGASSPVITTSAKRLEAGSFECLVEGADIAIARSIANYIGDVYIITPIGECKKVRLSNTKVSIRGEVAGTKYKFLASWQEID